MAALISSAFPAVAAWSGAGAFAFFAAMMGVPKGMGSQDLHMGDHPIAWTKCVGKGRAFYSAIGHRPETYSEPHNVRLLEHAIQWSAGSGDPICEGAKTN
jgi:hypothetical protein